MVFRINHFNKLEKFCFEPRKSERLNKSLKKSLVLGLSLSILALSAFAPWFYSNRRNHKEETNNVVQIEKYVLDKDLKEFIDYIGKDAKKPLDIKTLGVLIGDDYIAGELFGEIDGYAGSGNWICDNSKTKLFAYVDGHYTSKERDRIKYVLENYYFVKPTEPKQEYKKEHREQL